MHENWPQCRWGGGPCICIIEAVKGNYTVNPWWAWLTEIRWRTVWNQPEGQLRRVARKLASPSLFDSSSQQHSASHWPKMMWWWCAMGTWQRMGMTQKRSNSGPKAQALKSPAELFGSISMDFGPNFLLFLGWWERTNTSYWKWKVFFLVGRVSLLFLSRKKYREKVTQKRKCSWSER